MEQNKGIYIKILSIQVITKRHKPSKKEEPEGEK